MFPHHVARGLHRETADGDFGTSTFASACCARVASNANKVYQSVPVPLPQHVARGLHPEEFPCAVPEQNFASARCARAASLRLRSDKQPQCSLPQHVARGLHHVLVQLIDAVVKLCLSTLRAGCISLCPGWIQGIHGFASARCARAASANLYSCRCNHFVHSAVSR